MPDALSEFAPAKINLTLEIIGKRPDNYHELESLVVFANNAGDCLSISPEKPTQLSVTGPFGDAISGPNILSKTIRTLAETEPNLTIGHVTLDKRLPIASGIGGGSTNAAALLRAVRKLNPAHTDKIDWHGIAVSLGADVPVCLVGKASIMTGIGDILHPVSDLPLLHAVLAFPNISTPADKTARIFKALAAAPLSETQHTIHVPRFHTLMDVFSYLEGHPNSLLTPAATLFPSIQQTLNALAETHGCIAARLSGAGPTCFGLYRDEETARMAEHQLAREHPDWWTAQTTLS